MKGWRTVGLNAAIALIGVAQVTNWTDLLGSGPAAGWMVTAVAIANVLLRTLTTTPVGNRS